MQLLFYVLYFYLFSFIFININSKPFSLEQANITAILSAAAYCNKNDLYNIVWREPAKGFQIIDIIHDFATDVNGYIGVLSSQKTIYIVFRGSQSIRNWIEDFEVKQVDYSTFPECQCKVHKGFYNSAKNVIDDILLSIENLKSKYDYEIIVTGHSYGSAVAQFIAMELSAKRIDTTVYNFGQPRIGDGEFAIFVNTKILLWRIVHNRDIVPHIPTTKGFNYYHACGEVFEDEQNHIRFCSDIDCEDISCSRQYKIKDTNIKDHMIYLGKNMTCEE